MRPNMYRRKCVKVGGMLKGKTSSVLWQTAPNISFQGTFSYIECPGNQMKFMHSHRQPVRLCSSVSFSQTCTRVFTHAAVDKCPDKTRTAVHVAKGLYLLKHIMSSRWHVQKRRKQEKQDLGDIIGNGKYLVCSIIWSITFVKLLYNNSSDPDCCN